MDKRLIAEHFAKARNSYNHAALAQQQIARHMTDLLCRFLPRQEADSMLEIGCGTGIYSRMLLQTFHPRKLWLNDLCTEMEDCLGDLLSPDAPACFLPGDAESMDFPSGIQLITSCSTLQWFNEPEAFFAKCHTALAPGGVLAVSTFGPRNLHEIRHITGNGLHYPTLDELCRMLPAGLRLLHAEEDVVPLAFPTPVEVLKHLRQTGVTGTEKRMWTRGRLNDFCNAYTHTFPCPEGVTLTYHPIYIIAIKNEAS